MKSLWQRSGTRYERDARARSARAQSHRSRIQKSLKRNAERRRISSPARRSLLALAFVASVATGVAASAPLFDEVSDWLRNEPAEIASIAVLGNRQLTPGAVARATGVDRGTATRDVDLVQVEARLASHPWIRAAVATRLPGGQLVVQIEERVPMAVLSSGGAEASGSDAAWNFVDETGTPYAQMTTPIPNADVLPHLRSTHQLPLDEPHPDLATALELSRSIDDLGIERLAGHVELILPNPDSGFRADSAQGWTLDLVAREKRVVLGSKEPQTRLAHLQELLSAGLGEVQRADRIDLRFASRAVLSGGSVSD